MRMTPAARWTALSLAVVVALLIAFTTLLRDDPAPGGAPGGALSTEAGHHAGGDTGAALAEVRRRADLPPCPVGSGAAGPEALRATVVECAADGSAVDVARALAGRQVVLNLWAYWCATCVAELPAMAEYQRRVGPQVLVVTVHQDDNAGAALSRLADLGVRLPTLQDGRRRIASALKVPNVMPATVLLRPDGSVAKILPRDFTTADEIAAAVQSQ